MRLDSCFLSPEPGHLSIRVQEAGGPWGLALPLLAGEVRGLLRCAETHLLPCGLSRGIALLVAVTAGGGQGEHGRPLA